jgi:carbon-monoxide dehydrogenase large subunit
MSRIGSRLPRYEDPVLLHGNGRYVADLACGAMAMRFVRSPVARGIIRAVAAPSGARMITATDLADVKVLRPQLLRPDFVPISQPVLAAERAAYVGEPIAPRHR